jgi:tRNA(Arg) A34 adenosine deaminase TadA
MTNQQLFIRKAIKLALENVQSGQGGPFAALIVKDNIIIASGTNLVTSANDPTAHAEIIAIREACKVLGTFQLEGCEIYTSCEPCPMCLGAIYWARPAKLYFACTRQDAANAGFDDSLIYDELTKSINERKIPMLHLPQNEGITVFNEWKEKADKKNY